LFIVVFLTTNFLLKWLSDGHIGNIIFRFSKLEFGSGIGKIIDMRMTEYHFVLLYEDRIRAVSTLNESLVYEDIIELVRKFSCIFVPFVGKMIG
jgi:hypothetical protein